MAEVTYSPSDVASIEALRRMTPARKLEILRMLQDTARALTAAGIRMRHPDWTEEQVRKAVCEAFLNAGR